MIFLYVYLTISAISTLIIVSACVVSGRSSRVEEQFTFATENYVEEWDGVSAQIFA